MKEQWKWEYMPLYQDGFSQSLNEDRWLNPAWLYDSKRTCTTKEEAQLYLDRAIIDGERCAKRGTYQSCGGLGISTEPNKNHLVKKTRIKKRKVTDWEVIEEQEIDN